MRLITRKVGDNRALVFPSWHALLSFVAKKLEPKLGSRHRILWSKPDKSFLHKRVEYQLLFHEQDFKRVIKPALSPSQKHQTRKSNHHHP